MLGCQLKLSEIMTIYKHYGFSQIVHEENLSVKIKCAFSYLTPLQLLNIDIVERFEFRQKIVNEYRTTAGQCHEKSGFLISPDQNS